MIDLVNWTYPASRGRPWTAADRTNGPLDQALDRLRQQIPDLVVERLEVTYPADDDNVFFIRQSYDVDFIQLDTGPDGQTPFLIENGGRATTSDPEDAAEIIRRWLEQRSPAETDTLTRGPGWDMHGDSGHTCAQREQADGR